MRKNKLTALLLAAAMTLSAAVSCSDGSGKDSSDSTSYKVSVDGKQDGLADKEIKVSLTEKADANETEFTLNSVIDSGMKTEDGDRYIYLDITIDNASEKEYQLNILNNFYILLPDGEEAHYDVRTQLYAAKNMDEYIPSPFTVPAKGTFSGCVGGFIVGSDVNSFTVCFFPTLDNDRDKSNVFKVEVGEANITKLVPASE